MPLQSKRGELRNLRGNAAIPQCHLTIMPTIDRVVLIQFLVKKIVILKHNFSLKKKNELFVCINRDTAPKFTVRKLS